MIKKKLKFGISYYFKRTPKMLGTIGSIAGAILAVLSVSSFAMAQPWYGAVTLILSLISKILPQFFGEEHEDKTTDSEPS